MPQCCAVPFCSEKTGGHIFPKDKTRTKQWLVAIRRDNYTPSKHARVCKKHFKPDDYVLPKESYAEKPTPMLNQTAVPSIFSWNCETEDREAMKKTRVERSLQHRKKQKTATVTICSKTDQYNKSKEYIISEEKCEETDIENTNKHVTVQCSPDIHYYINSAHSVNVM